MRNEFDAMQALGAVREHGRRISLQMRRTEITFEKRRRRTSYQLFQRHHSYSRHRR